MTFQPEDELPIPYLLTNDLTTEQRVQAVQDFWDDHVCDHTCRPNLEEVRDAFKDALGEGLNRRG